MNPGLHSESTSADEKRSIMAALISLAAIVPSTDILAQHVSDNPVTAADDAYGLTLGLESVGLYSPGLVRGFSPKSAGNVRVDGLYFDQQGALSNRVIDGSTIRVGVTEVGYAFPAPTGIVDYALRNPTDAAGATMIANVGPYDGWGVSVDGSLPLIGNALVLPLGLSTQQSTQTSSYGPYPGYTSKVTSAGATPVWSPSDTFSARAILDWQGTTAARTFPLYFTAGDFSPPRISTGYLGQDWAEGRNVTTNFGGLVSARFSKVWSFRAGIFRSTNDWPTSFSDEYVDIRPNGQADHVLVGYPDQNTRSVSGEMRLTGTFTSSNWRQQVILSARGRDTTVLYGGEDQVDAGYTLIGVPLQVPRPDFNYSVASTDHTELWSVGSSYRLLWRQLAEISVGIQKESYRETDVTPGVPASGISTTPLRAYGNAAFALGRAWTLYGGYTQGLENSGVAPGSAANGGTVLPASLTWQVDAGLRFVVNPHLKIIAGAFELQKPYFNFDTQNVDRKLGVQQAKGLELSIAGELARGLNVNVGILDGKVGISGPALTADGVGPVAVGQPRLMYAADANYAFPWWPAASLDVSGTHFGAAPESVDNGTNTPKVTQWNLGGRYSFTAWGVKNSVRLQVQNVMATSVWVGQYTPGFFQWPGPRTVFAYLTTDFR